MLNRVERQGIAGATAEERMMLLSLPFRVIRRGTAWT